jgi:CBS domain-containing protein
MAVCPDCGYDNIAGTDECEECGQSLTELSDVIPTSPLAKGLVNDSIDSLSPREPVAVSPDEKVGHVLDLLVDNHIGCVLVVDGDDLIGIFSERDALVRLNTEAEELKDRPIKEFMTDSPSTLQGHDTIAYAVHKMSLGGYRHIPILTNGKPTGVISIRDVLRYATERQQSA